MKSFESSLPSQGLPCASARRRRKYIMLGMGLALGADLFGEL
jgi:hypothetical protein